MMKENTEAGILWANLRAKSTFSRRKMWFFRTPESCTRTYYRHIWWACIPLLLNQKAGLRRNVPCREKKMIERVPFKARVGNVRCGAEGTIQPRAFLAKKGTRQAALQNWVFSMDLLIAWTRLWQLSWWSSAYSYKGAADKGKGIPVSLSIWKDFHVVFAHL